MAVSGDFISSLRTFFKWSSSQSEPLQAQRGDMIKLTETGHIFRVFTVVPPSGQHIALAPWDSVLDKGWSTWTHPGEYEIVATDRAGTGLPSVESFREKLKAEPPMAIASGQNAVLAFT